MYVLIKKTKSGCLYCYTENE